MKVTETEFMELFPDRYDLWHLLTTKPKDYNDLVRNYLPSKVWRLNNIYSIINKYGDPVRFVMNRAQLIVYSKTLIHPRVIILKSRQQGISTLWLMSFMDDALFKSNYNAGLMAQGKDEARTLLERVKFTWESLDPWIKALLGRRVVKDNASEFEFNNGSTLFIRTSFRSATLQRLHISELGKIANKYPERAKETKTGTLQALAPGNTGVIESTAEGNNMFKHMYYGAKEQYALGQLAAKDFLPVFLSWLDDPDCVESVLQIGDDEEDAYLAQLEVKTGRTLSREQRNFWIAQHRELEEDVYQEYPATDDEAFAAAQNGTYWAKRYVSRVLQRDHKKPYLDLYDPNLDLYICMDAGRSDYTVIVFFQVYRKTLRILKEMYNTGEWIGYYADEVAIICEEEDWTVTHWYLPHDMGVVDYTQRSKTREEILNECGVTATTILEKMDKQSSREQVRQEFDNIYIAEECVYLEGCCMNYTKEWNPLLDVWRDENKRNKWAHGADTLRYVVQTCHEFLYEEWESQESDTVDTNDILI